ncbi:MAG TPA: Pr6Pr family membrane protein, partial [Acidobacteriaceae bacterium]|nr:Pr6Pr family membrane protein [Acidobacteriaceae bacterium]
MESTAKLRQFYLGVLAVLAWLAVALQLYLTVKVVTAAGQPAIHGVINTLSYFTILTNILVAIVATASLLRANKDTFLTRPSTMSAIAVYIFIVGMIYSLILRALWNPTGLQLVVDRILHDAVPVLYVLFWLFFVRKGALRWMQPFYWLIYPVVYFVYCLVRGALTGWYPYPFADVTKLGYPAVVANSGMILGGFLVVSFSVVAIDRLVGRLLRRL